jgi:hypothetical protein
MKEQSPRAAWAALRLRDEYSGCGVYSEIAPTELSAKSGKSEYPTRIAPPASPHQIARAARFARIIDWEWQFA